MPECQLSRTRLYYQEFGEGRPVLLLHGRPLDHQETVFEMEPHFAARAGWRRLHVDLPGCGRTPGPDWVTTGEDVLAVLEEFLDNVLAEARPVIVATSSGAYLARGLVHRRGKEFDGIFLNVPVIVAEHAKRRRPPRTVLARDEKIEATARAENNTWIERVTVVQSEATLEYARALSRCVVDEAFLDRLKLPFRFEVDSLPEPFQAPALFIMGRQDNVVGFEDALALAPSYPHGTFAVLDRAGHMVLKEQEAICRALISDWLDRVEEWSSRTA